MIQNFSLIESESFLHTFPHHPVAFSIDSQLQLSEAQLRDRTVQLETRVEAQQHDNHLLSQQVALSQSTEIRVTEDCNALRTQNKQLRGELDSVYAERSTINAELEQVRDNVLRTDTMRSRLEAENSELANERISLTDALSSAERQKRALLEDLEVFQRESERHKNMLTTISAEKDKLSIQNSEIILQVTTFV